MTPREEAEFEVKAEKMLAGQREVPNGRNCFAWTMRFLNNRGYREKFDTTFSDAPSSEEWWREKFCVECGKRKAWCECDQ